VDKSFATPGGWLLAASCWHEQYIYVSGTFPL
jgi:hypothetical protein